MLELEGKYFKATVETVLKDIKENMLIINKNIGNIYREIKIINQKIKGKWDLFIWSSYNGKIDTNSKDYTKGCIVGRPIQSVIFYVY